MWGIVAESFIFHKWQTTERIILKRILKFTNQYMYVLKAGESELLATTKDSRIRFCKSLWCLWKTYQPDAQFKGKLIKEKQKKRGELPVDKLYWNEYGQTVGTFQVRHVAPWRPCSYLQSAHGAGRHPGGLRTNNMFIEKYLNVHWVVFKIPLYYRTKQADNLHMSSDCNPENS